MKDRLGALLGESPLIVGIRTQVAELLTRQTATRRFPPILILGETGTGKGLLARAIHDAGPRRGHPFVEVNCAAIPETLLEAELFGYERGAFTDARQAKPGLFQTADGGTLFLDEIGLLPTGLQGKLLSALEARAVRRLGSTQAEPVDVAYLAATSVDLKRAVAEGRFREDLFHRLTVITLELPPLRRRGADSLALAEHFLAHASAEYGLPPRTLMADARAKLAAYRWPGNVRELANTMERVALLSGTSEITAAMIDFSTTASSVVGSLDEMLRARIEAALRDTSGNIRRSAAVLGISRNTLRARMKKYGLRHHEASEPSSRASPARQRMAPAGAEGRRTPSGAVPDLTVPGHNLPTPLTVFIGREAEVAEIRRLLVGDPDCRLLTLVGPGGIGKTRLALRVADTVLDTHVEHGKFAQGVFFVPLEAARNASDIVTGILSVLVEDSGGSIQPAPSLHEQLLDFVRAKNLLLVLDNVEQLVAEADLLAEILAAAPGVRILATSRVALNLRLEWVHPVAGLAYPRAGAPADRTMMTYDGVRLFAHHARRARVDFSLTDDFEHMLRLCSLVEGNPLAIELASAWLRGLSCQRVVQELEHGLDILTTRHQSTPFRHRSMRAVLEQSWQRLARSGQNVLGRLAVCESGFTLDAAVAIAGASPDDLTLLAESSMVRLASPGRYQMHDLLRQFVAEQGVDEDSAHEAHSRYFVTFAQERYVVFLDRRYPEAIEDLSVERDNLRAAWRWLVGRLHVEQHLDTALESLEALVHPLAWFYRELGLNWEGRAVFDAACTAVIGILGQAGPSSERNQRIQVLLARLQIRLASFLYVLGEYDLVDRAIAAALPVVHAEMLAEEEGLALEVAARAHLRRGNHQASRIAAEQSMALARQTGNDLHATDAQVLLARAAADEGDYDSAVRMHQETVESYRRLNYTAGTARALTNLGNTHILRGDYAAAKPLFEQAYAIAQENSNRFLLMFAGTNLGEVMSQLGHHAEAAVYFRQNLVLARESGDQRWLAVNLNHLSLTDLHRNDLDGAEQHAKRALGVAHAIGCEPDALCSLAYLARVWARRGHVEPALRALLYVDSHPATLPFYKAFNATLLVALREATANDVVAAALAWGKAKQLDDVVTWVGGAP